MQSDRIGTTGMELALISFGTFRLSSKSLRCLPPAGDIYTGTISVLLLPLLVCCGISNIQMMNENKQITQGLLGSA
jgi:hypothetical protein